MSMYVCVPMCIFECADTCVCASVCVRMCALAAQQRRMEQRQEEDKQESHPLPSQRSDGVLAGFVPPTDSPWGLCDTTMLLTDSQAKSYHLSKLDTSQRTQYSSKIQPDSFSSAVPR